MEVRTSLLSIVSSGISFELIQKVLMRKRCSSLPGWAGIACVIAIALTATTAPVLRAQPAEDRPGGQVREPAGAQATGKPSGSRFALGLKASTLGAGVDAGLRLARRFNVRVGFNAFDYHRNLSNDGISYDSAFRLRSVQALVDWFPFRKSFHLSGGLLLYNGNHMSAHALVPSNQVLDAGDEAVISDPANPITGKARSTARVVPPMVAIGFGNFVPRTRRVGFSIDVGVVFQGAPHSTLTLRGSACDPSGEFCGDIAGDPNIQAESLAARRTIDKDLFFMKYYPFVSLELGYRF
jgi:hypothetical protein